MIVLFKDKKKKKIIKKFITFKRAKQFYNKLLDKSKEVIFDVRFQSGKECKFELGLVELSSKQLIPARNLRRCPWTKSPASPTK